MKTPSQQELEDSLTDIVEQLAPLVRAGMSGRSAVAFAMEQGSFGGKDDFTPSIEKRQQAITEYMKLPAHVRSQIQNGWTADPCNAPTRHELEKTQAEYSACSVGAVLTISAGVNAIASQQFELLINERPVQLRILLGTSKADALRALHELSSAVINFYGEMISRPCCSIDELEREADRVRVSDRLRAVIATEARAKRSEQAAAKPGKRTAKTARPNSA